VSQGCLDSFGLPQDVQLTHTHAVQTKAGTKPVQRGNLEEASRAPEVASQRSQEVASGQDPRGSPRGCLDELTGQKRMPQVTPPDPLLFFYLLLYSPHTAEEET
jgi:hypothetical protein